MDKKARAAFWVEVGKSASAPPSAVKYVAIAVCLWRDAYAGKAISFAAGKPEIDTPRHLCLQILLRAVAGEASRSPHELTFTYFDILCVYNRE